MPSGQESLSTRSTTLTQASDVAAAASAAKATSVRLRRELAVQPTTRARAVRSHWHPSSNNSKTPWPKPTSLPSLSTATRRWSRSNSPPLCPRPNSTLPRRSAREPSSSLSPDPSPRRERNLVSEHVVGRLDALQSQIHLRLPAMVGGVCEVSP